MLLPGSENGDLPIHKIVHLQGPIGGGDPGVIQVESSGLEECFRFSCIQKEVGVVGKKEQKKREREREKEKRTQGRKAS